MSFDSRAFLVKFEKYACDYAPLSWDTSRSDHRAFYRRSHDFLTSYVRYRKVMVELAKIWRPGMSVADFGVFPGVIPKIFREFFPVENYQYTGIGLMFTPEFVRCMKTLDVTLIESELDPAFHKPSAFHALTCTNINVVFFLDIIEHLSNPFYALDAANRAMAKGGYLILTTDNFTSFEHVLAVLRGRSALPHPLHTNMFYTGEWRPHAREYGRDDLIWVLEHSGFKVISHEYFDRQQAEWRIVRNKLVHDAGACYGFGASLGPAQVFKKGVYMALKQLASAVRHWRNHQIVVAVKTAEISELKGRRPEVQSTMDGWRAIRRTYLKES